MNVTSLIKKLTTMNYQDLAKSIYKIVNDDPAFFNIEDIINSIYSKYKETKDINLAYLHSDINKNGLLI